MEVIETLSKRNIIFLKVLVYAVLVLALHHAILSLGSGVACDVRHVESEKNTCSSGVTSMFETILCDPSSKLHPTSSPRVLCLAARSLGEVL